MSSDNQLLNRPKENSYFKFHQDRLALFYDTKTYENFWTKRWTPDLVSSYLKSGFEGDVGCLEPYMHLIPEGGHVLEGGCGPGRMVAALQKRNIKVTGVEYEKDLVDMINQQFPQLNLIHGDVLNFNFPDNTFDCYSSLGVIEHFENGPKNAIQEGKRILKKGGIAFFEIPHLNIHRVNQISYSPKNLKNDNDKFHQYYFSEEEFTIMLNDAGFEILDREPEGELAFLTREHKFFSKFWKSSLCREKIKSLIRKGLPLLSKSWRINRCHMLTYICKLCK